MMRSIEQRSGERYCGKKQALLLVFDIGKRHLVAPNRVRERVVTSFSRQKAPTWGIAFWASQDAPFCLPGII
jgi:hypothetical protein